MALRVIGILLIALLVAQLSVLSGMSPACAQADPKGLLRALEGAFVDVAEKVTPAVVHVSARQKAKPQEEGQPRLEERFKDFFGEEFMERFFRRRPPR